ncbi:MAG: hypothetical protein Q7U16_06915 [Agitococcus sp.]|nr:hypothetical protein [Agitococcus sp.]
MKMLLISAQCIVIVSAISFIFISETQAGDSILWRGWTNFGSCNRMTHYYDDFGLPWPTNESVGQTLNGEIYLARTVDEVAKNHLSSCALKAVAVAGASALLTSGASAWPVFTSSFNTCLTSENLTQFIGDNISIRYDTHCNW